MTIAQNAQWIATNQHITPRELSEAGWKYLGGGSYRYSYLGPDGKVYKVQHDSDVVYDGDKTENYMEWEMYMLYAKKIRRSKIVRLARCFGYIPENNVIVMEYVPNDGPAWEYDEWNINPVDAKVAAAEKVLTDCYIYDFGPDNGWMHNGMVVLVDYAQ